MAYVDLNPVRAGMAETPEDSDHTSIQERIAPRFNLSEAIQTQSEQLFLKQFPLRLKPLLNFEGAVRNETQRGILFGLTDYLELVDFTGRIINPNKRGYIPENQPPILTRLGLTLPKNGLPKTPSFKTGIRPIVVIIWIGDDPRPDIKQPLPN
ncbi:hypothetical protein [Marinobacter sp. OP 3.4]|uniref:hypothetical protein n=1 Tax=Marinobacter sp. OP 3.4 TaxID=3076501 RepID=UPI002E1F9CBC